MNYLFFENIEARGPGVPNDLGVGFKLMVKGGTMEKKGMDKTFGGMAVEKDFITQEQLDDALKIQVEELKSKEKARPIGRILLNEGLITMQQVGDVLKALEKWH